MIRFKEIPLTQIGVFNVELEQKVHMFLIPVRAQSRGQTDLGPVVQEWALGLTD